MGLTFPVTLYSVYICRAARSVNCCFKRFIFTKSRLLAAGRQCEQVCSLPPVEKIKLLMSFFYSIRFMSNKKDEVPKK